MTTILVIEDDIRIQKALNRLFEAEGYQVRNASDGIAGLESFYGSAPDAVILDLMLPGLSGRDICRSMKQSSPETPVLILSAVSEVADKVLLLELGADDFVTKPFSPRELLARVQSAMRRVKRVKPGFALSFGDVHVDFADVCALPRRGPVASSPRMLCRMVAARLPCGVPGTRWSAATGLSMSSTRPSFSPALNRRRPETLTGYFETLSSLVCSCCLISACCIFALLSDLLHGLCKIVTAAGRDVWR